MPSREIADRLDGVVFRPGDPGYEEELLGYNRIVEHRPRLVVGAASTEDVAHSVRRAAVKGWSVGVMATGHGASIPAHDLLITTKRMDKVSVDSATRTATVQAGVRGRDLVAAAGNHNLAYLGGSSPAVGVVGYLSGGGLPLMGRAFGYGADRVRALTLVTADGVVHRLDATDESDLFWGALGSKDNMGVITEVEIELLPVAEVNAGGLWWTGESVSAAVSAWLEWIELLPDEMCSSMLVMSMPDADFAPPLLRGKRFAHVRLIHPGARDTAEDLVQSLRRVPGLVQDTFARMRTSDLGSVHAEPDEPTRFDAYTSRILVDQHARTQLVNALRASVSFLLEIRHLGGRLGSPSAGPVSYADSNLGVYSGQTVLPDVDPSASSAAQREFHAALKPWRLGSMLSFISGPSASQVPLADCYDAATIDRLRRVKSVADPENVFRHNVNVSSVGVARRP